MDKIKIGIPRSLYYYYDGELLKLFFEYLGYTVVISPNTNKQILDQGIKYATDEMCLSLKNYIGHVEYLQDKCDYIVIPRIDNFGISNQTCTNFLSLYDIIHNLFNTPILNYNIDLEHHDTEEKGFYKMGIELKHSKKEIKKAYFKAKIDYMNKRDKKIRNNEAKLNSFKPKVLLVGHPYNLYDFCIGIPITNYLKTMDVEVIYSDLFPSEITSRLSSNLSSELYFKYNKENIGAIEYAKNKIDGVIFLTTFPCGPDSLVNELVMRKIELPYLNLVLDDLDGNAGLETRIESFLDILKERKKLCQE